MRTATLAPKLHPVSVLTHLVRAGLKAATKSSATNYVVQPGYDAHFVGMAKYGGRHVNVEWRERTKPAWYRPHKDMTEEQVAKVLRQEQAELQAKLEAAQAALQAAGYTCTVAQPNRTSHYLALEVRLAA